MINRYVSYGHFSQWNESIINSYIDSKDIIYFNFLFDVSDIKIHEIAGVSAIACYAEVFFAERMFFGEMKSYIKCYTSIAGALMPKLIIAVRIDRDNTEWVFDLIRELIDRLDTITPDELYKLNSDVLDRRRRDLMKDRCKTNVKRAKAFISMPDAYDEYINGYESLFYGIDSSKVSSSCTLSERPCMLAISGNALDIDRYARLYATLSLPSETKNAEDCTHDFAKEVAIKPRPMFLESPSEAAMALRYDGSRYGYDEVAAHIADMEYLLPEARNRSGAYNHGIDISGRDMIVAYTSADPEPVGSLSLFNHIVSFLCSDKLPMDLSLYTKGTLNRLLRPTHEAELVSERLNDYITGWTAGFLSEKVERIRTCTASEILKTAEKWSKAEEKAFCVSGVLHTIVH